LTTLLIERPPLRERDKGGTRPQRMQERLA